MITVLVNARTMETKVSVRAVSAEETRRAVVAMSLRSCQLFTGLGAPELEEIAGLVQLRVLTKGEYLFRENEPATGFYVMQRGAVNVHRVSAAGKEQVIHVFRAGESFAEAALASPTGYPADARAVEESTLFIVPKDKFLALVAKRPDLALRMLGSMSQHLRVLVGLLDDLTLKDVETRLANWLVRRCPKTGAGAVKVELGRTKRVLAAELGTTAETLSRTLAQFRGQELILVKGGAVTVLAPERLRGLLRRNLGEG